MNVKQQKQDCCGCTACQAICPQKAITMVPDEEGFLYPAIDEERCVHCDLCRKVCAFEDGYLAKIGKTEEPAFEQTYCAGSSTEEAVVCCSRSGGIFYALARQVIEAGGVVYGVAMTEALEAVLQRVDNLEELPRLQGSKYVQASMGEEFPRVAQDLRQNRKVFFAGTACQVAGLRSYLQTARVDMQNLYTADLICHGVPSPQIFRDNVRELETRWHLKIQSVNFRDKALGWRPHIESYEGVNAAGKTKKRYSNQYTSLFYAGVILRPSCHRCAFCNFQRPGDLTLADFWGMDQVQARQHARSGLSELLVNSEKGEKMVQGLTGVSLQTITREAASRQPNLYHPTKPSAQRDNFWALYRQYGYRKAAHTHYKLVERIKVPYNRLKYRK